MQKFNGKMILIENIDEAFDALDAGKKVVVLRPFDLNGSISDLRGIVCIAALEREDSKPKPKKEEKPEPPAPVAHLIEKLDKTQEPKRKGRPPKNIGVLPVQPKVLTSEEKEAIAEAYLAGVSHTKNAEQHGCTVNDIFTVLREKELIDVVPGA